MTQETTDNKITLRNYLTCDPIDLDDFAVPINSNLAKADKSMSTLADIFQHYGIEVTEYSDKCIRFTGIAEIALGFARRVAQAYDYPCTDLYRHYRLVKSEARRAEWIMVFNLAQQEPQG